MRAQFNDEELEFRQEVRKFFQEAYTPEMASLVKNADTFKQGIIDWHKVLHQKGWIAPNWPVEYGGTGWSATQKYIFGNELAEAGCPEILPFGIKMVGPVIYAFGTPAQKERFLPRILSTDDWWCQGYSEPGAGSDLTALKTSAVRDGDNYIVDGTKVWTSYAQHADWIFCLVRTDKSGKPQQGITFLLIDMNTPGITVNPIETIDGKHTLNEVVFDGVKVPLENRIGDENNGWTYAKSLLTHERTMLAGVAYCKRMLRNIKKNASDELVNGVPLMQNPVFQQRVADLEIELMAMEYTELRVLAAVAAGGAPGLESSLLKVKGTELQQALQSLQMETAGYYGGIIPGAVALDDIGHDYGAEARREYMYGRASTLYGGSNEVQKNIMAKYVLGL